MPSKAKVQKGHVIQRPEARALNSENVGSNPAMPTINLLVAKKCERCKIAMHIHRAGEQVIFSNCEPMVISVSLEAAANEITIRGKRSTKTVRCQSCKRRHLLRSFEVVKDEAPL